MQKVVQRGTLSHLPHAVDGRGARRQSHLARLHSDIAASKAGDLSEDERNDLLLMREEEKVARDVYLHLFDRWGLRPFGNISGAEQAHMDAILMLLQRYGEVDPVQGLAIGEFHRPDMQALYDRLVEQGLRSREEAVRVGLAIEELDIADLRAAAERTRKPEILVVYASLERGSRNHLRAFYRWMQRLGAHYAPTHLTEGEFEAIAISEHEICQ